MNDLEAGDLAPPQQPGSARGPWLTEPFRNLAIATQFLSRLPTPALDLGNDAARHEAMARSTAYFPLVGALIGASTGLTIWLAAHLWSMGIAVLLGLAVEALVTGAFHEDAVADFCDAFGGGWTRDDVLRILKDSRVGSFGIVGLGLAFALRVGALASLEPSELLAVTMASGCLGRWAVLPAMWGLPPLADRAGLSRDVGRQIPFQRIVLGTLLAIPGCLAMGWLAPGRLGLALLGIVALTFWLVRYVKRRIGGMSGDCLGFLCYLAQVLVLLAACAHWKPLLETTP